MRQQSNQKLPYYIFNYLFASLELVMRFILFQIVLAIIFVVSLAYTPKVSQ